MLRQRDVSNTMPVSWTRILQNLSIFVAEVEVGTFVRPGDPSYALLSKATLSIRRFLDSKHNEVIPQVGSQDWAALLSHDSWDFEFPFWENLSDRLSVDPLSNM